MDKPAALEELIQALRCLPGVGPKSAQRMAAVMGGMNLPPGFKLPV